LLLELEGVYELEERRLFTGSLTSLQERCLHVGLCARAARGSSDGDVRLLVGAGGLVAHELTLGAGAESRLLALPLALGLLAHRSADGVGGSAGGTALSRGTHSLALGAVSLLAEVLGAANVTLGLVAVDLAGGAGGLLAVNLALRSLTYRVALSRAHWIITLPAAIRVAITLSGSHEGEGGDDGQ